MMKTSALLGASGGLGEAVAQAIAARGPLGLGYGRNRATAEALAERIAIAVIDAGIIYAPEFAANELAQGVISAMVANTPLGRMARPQEVSAVVDFVLSPGAA